MRRVVLGAGCFWCSEAVFSRVSGVIGTMPGYSGGNVENPSYEQVCKGGTGHIEVVRVEYDDSYISLDRLLDIFFEMHDPTSLDKQGGDVGFQYRSVIFYEDDGDIETIEKSIGRAQGRYSRKIVTEVRKLKVFYPAESYHKDYFLNNPNKPYCRLVISPKVTKAKMEFPEIVVK
ncbi:MAG: peptide-methionine (S)-S-oxide reductase MsrA [Thermoplasmata archaeon]